MFDLGFLEIMTIGIVALVVIGPERLPEVAAKVGRYVGKAQRFVRGVRSDISRELETGDLKKLIGDQKEQIDELRQMVHTATKDIESSTSGAMRDAQSSINSLGNDVKSAVDESRVTDNGVTYSGVNESSGVSENANNQSATLSNDVAGETVGSDAGNADNAPAVNDATNKDTSNP